jgi:predicted RecB family nuclease
MHLNRDYRYDGREHQPSQLFTTSDVTKQVLEMDAELPGLLRAQRAALAGGAPPDVEPGPQCTRPYLCEFHGHCNPALPDHHISTLPRLSAKKQQALAELGIETIHQIPDDFPLTEVQARVWTSVRTSQVSVSDSLRELLPELKHPLYFMDFESLYSAIPRFAGMRPYAQIPFQWSVHRQLAAGAALEHWEFLADDASDPRLAFAESLCGVLGKRGPILVYNAGFESARLRELADWLPAYGVRIEKIRERLWDLLPFVRAHVYHPDFGGSFSIKSVLPALAGMTYAGMEVADGGQAGLTWERMLHGGVDAAERARLKAALLAYCRQDTLAMVKILERLHAFAAPTFGHGNGFLALNGPLAPDYGAK